MQTCNEASLNLCSIFKLTTTEKYGFVTFAHHALPVIYVISSEYYFVGNKRKLIFWKRGLHIYGGRKPTYLVSQSCISMYIHVYPVMHGGWRIPTIQKHTDNRENTHVPYKRKIHISSRWRREKTHIFSIWKRKPTYSVYGRENPHIQYMQVKTHIFSIGKRKPTISVQGRE